MSGIAGLVNGDGTPLSRALLQDLAASLKFRGPDGQEQWLDGPVGLTHTRVLASSRAESERQPCMRDGRLWITADIRLDYRDELIGRLPARSGQKLSTSSDAELVLAAYDAWADDCLRYLFGDFAFILWDQPRRRILAAVDHFRIRSLFYSLADRGIVLSNTLECVLRHPAVSDRLNETALGDFLLFEYYQDKDATIYADVQRLPPAHYLTWEEGQVRISRYWSLPQENPDPGPAGDRLEQFDQLLTQAVKDRLIGRKVGVTLSGGLDSSLIAAKAQELLAGSGAAEPLHAFTLVYDHLISDQERYYSGLVAQAIGIGQTIETGDDFKLFGGGAGPNWRPPPEPVGSDRWEGYVRHVQRMSASCPAVLTGVEGDAPLSASLFHHWRRLLRTGRLKRFVRDAAWYIATPQHRLPQIGVRSALRKTIAN